MSARDCRRSVDRAAPPNRTAIRSQQRGREQRRRQGRASDRRHVKTRNHRSRTSPTLWSRWVGRLASSMPQERRSFDGGRSRSDSHPNRWRFSAIVLPFGRERRVEPRRRRAPARLAQRVPSSPLRCAVTGSKVRETTGAPRRAAFLVRAGSAQRAAVERGDACEQRPGAPDRPRPVTSPLRAAGACAPAAR